MAPWTWKVDSAGGGDCWAGTGRRGRVRRGTGVATGGVVFRRVLLGFLGLSILFFTSPCMGGQMVSGAGQIVSGSKKMLMRLISGEFPSLPGVAGFLYESGRDAAG